MLVLLLGVETFRVNLVFHGVRDEKFFIFLLGFSYYLFVLSANYVLTM